MKYLTQLQNAYRLAVITNKLTEEIEWFEKFVLPNAILENQMGPVGAYLGDKIMAVNRYLAETEPLHIAEKQISAESKIDQPSHWEEFSAIKKKINVLLSTLLKDYPNFDLAQYLKRLDSYFLPIHITNAENQAVADIKIKAEYYLKQANIFFKHINQDMSDSYFKIKSARAYYREARSQFKRIGEHTYLQEIDHLLKALDEIVKKYKNNVNTSTTTSTTQMLRDLVQWDEDIKAEAIFEEDYLQDCILGESMTELNKYHEEMLIPLSPDTKYRKILALDIDNTIILDGRTFHPDLKCINIDELAKTLRSTPPDVMIVLLTARYFPEFGNQDAHRVAEELNEKVGRKVVQSIIYSCAEPKPLSLRDLYRRHLQCQANTSHTDVGLLDDKIHIVEDVNKAGFVGIHARLNSLDHYQEVAQFVKKPAQPNQQIQPIQQPTMSSSKI